MTHASTPLPQAAKYRPQLLVHPLNAVHSSLLLTDFTNRLCLLGRSFCHSASLSHVVGHAETLLTCRGAPSFLTSALWLFNITSMEVRSL